MRIRDFARGLALGGLAAYLFDRRRGKQRRAALRDRAVHLAHQIDQAAGKTARDARNRSRGMVAMLSSWRQGNGVDPVVLSERVHAAIGRVVSHPGAIDIDVRDGEVHLSGHVLERDLHRLISTVESVRGVHGVHNNLTVHESTEGISSLQGGRRRESRFELRQRNWSPTARFLTGLAGAGMALVGRRFLPLRIRALAQALGLGILTRALTNLESRRLFGINAGRRAVDIHKTINVDVPIEEVFDFWSRFENFPRFMTHLRAVQRTGERTSHWVARGPGGIGVHWDAEITALEPDRRISWRSVDGAIVQNAGTVHFEPTPDGGTRLDIHMCYNPPAGVLGHTVAALLGADPKHALADDLVRFKSLLEEGKTSAQGEVMREDLPQAPKSWRRAG